jgi:hypothetical protein
VQRRYRPDWELLAEALRRVQNETGLTENEAKADLCLAFGDGKISIQVPIAKISRRGGDLLVGRFVPGSNVSPDDFDWQRSLLLKPTISFYSIDYQPIGAIKVSTNDLTEALAGRFGSAEHDRDRSEQQTLGQRRLVRPTETEKSSTSGSTRPFTKKTAKKFAAEYIDRKKKAAERPTLMGLETAAKEANLHGGRDLLRAAFKQGVGTEVRRGRPRKIRRRNSPKNNRREFANFDACLRPCMFGGMTARSHVDIRIISLPAAAHSFAGGNFTTCKRYVRPRLLPDAKPISIEQARQ